MTKPDLIPSRGAIGEDLMLEVRRDLTPQDLLRMGEVQRTGVPVIQRLRHTHHRQAQLLAQGKTLNEVATLVGCTVARLVQLQNDPMFMDLLAIYQDQILVADLEATARIREKLVDIGEMAVDELAERLSDDTERKKMPTGEVRKAAEMALDRTVAPPKSAPAQSTAPQAVTINFGTGLRPVHEERVINGKVDEEGK